MWVKNAVRSTWKVSGELIEPLISPFFSLINVQIYDEHYLPSLMKLIPSGKKKKKKKKKKPISISISPSTPLRIRFVYNSSTTLISSCDSLLRLRTPPPTFAMLPSQSTGLSESTWCWKEDVQILISVADLSFFPLLSICVLIASPSTRCVVSW
jgi:hypothetical protein